MIRGPATLRWGSQAIGGVVNVDNNRIPTWIPRGGFLLDTKGGATTVDNGVEGAVLLDAGKGNFAFHADAFGRRADDYRIPGYPYLFPPDPAPFVNGTQPNSSLRTNGAVRRRLIPVRRRLRRASRSPISTASIASRASRRRRPAPASTLHQTKVNSKGEFRPQASAIDAIRFWLGAIRLQA